MLLDTFLQPSDNTTIAKSSTLYLTNKTLRFGDDVYQFRNVTGFGIGEVKPKKIPFLFIFGFFVAGFVVRNSNGYFGGTLLIISILAFVINISQPKLYGLKVYLNYGDGQIFITSDTAWLGRAIGVLNDFMENAQDGNYLSINVGGNFAGNMITNSSIGDIFNQ